MCWVLIPTKHEYHMIELFTWVVRVPVPWTCLCRSTYSGWITTLKVTSHHNITKGAHNLEPWRWGSRRSSSFTGSSTTKYLQPSSPETSYCAFPRTIFLVVKRAELLNLALIGFREECKDVYDQAHHFIFSELFQIKLSLHHFSSCPQQHAKYHAHASLAMLKIGILLDEPT